MGCLIWLQSSIDLLESNQVFLQIMVKKVWSISKSSLRCTAVQVKANTKVDQCHVLNCTLATKILWVRLKIDKFTSLREKLVLVREKLCFQTLWPLSWNHILTYNSDDVRSLPTNYSKVSKMSIRSCMKKTCNLLSGSSVAYSIFLYKVRYESDKWPLKVIGKNSRFIEVLILDSLGHENVKFTYKCSWSLHSQCILCLYLYFVLQFSINLYKVANISVVFFNRNTDLGPFFSEEEFYSWRR